MVLACIMSLTSSAQASNGFTTGDDDDYVWVDSLAFELTDHGSHSQYYKDGKCELSKSSSLIFKATIPNRIYDNKHYRAEHPYNVGTIKLTAFDGCSRLSSITIPSGVSVIEWGTLSDCSELTEFIVASDNKYFNSIDGVLFKSINGVSTLYRFPIKHRQKYSLPQEVSNITDKAFYGCFIDTLEVNKSFNGFSSSSPFSNLKSTVVLNCRTDGSLLKDLNSESCVIADGRDFTNIRKYWSGKLKPTSPVWIDDINTDLTFASFKVYTSETDDIAIKSVIFNDTEIQHDDNGVYHLRNLLPSSTYEIGIRYIEKGIENTLPYSFQTAVPSITTANTESYEGKIRCCVSAQGNASETGLYCVETGKYYKTIDDVCDVTGLCPDTRYTLRPYARYSGRLYGVGLPDASLNANAKDVSAKTIKASFRYKTTCTQTTITVSDLKLGSDGTLEISELGFIEGENRLNQTSYTATGLSPNNRHYFKFYAKIGDSEYTDGSYLNTAGFNPSIKTTVTPTTVLINTSYTEKEAKVTSCELYIKGEKQSITNDILLTGLRPGESISISFKVYPTGETATETATASPAISFETLEPKTVSNTTAVVAATTNISDEELGAGFEWRKVDAPDVVSSRRGSGRIYDGVLEGRIQGLASDSYYKVRPFYKSNSGAEYFGEWKGFDPSDFSYFEPTVHTYPVTSVSATSASVRAYVMAGTDEIDEQGIEYWPVGSPEAKKVKDKANAGNVTTIISSGQVMNVALENLQPSTTYVCRAYVKAGGSTTYGEEQTFTTENASGIIGIEAGDNGDITVTGYYNLQGIRFDTPQKGLNIVKYSDGSVVKTIY